MTMMTIVSQDENHDAHDDDHDVDDETDPKVFFEIRHAAEPTSCLHVDLHSRDDFDYDDVDDDDVDDDDLE